MKLYFVAGEASGDSRGAELMRELQQGIPGVAFCGAGGPEMKAICPGIEDWAGEAVVGLWDVLKKYGYFRAQMHRMLDEIAREQPDALITVDYPGFNMRLAKAAKARNPKLRTIHYVSPQVWAWHRGRIPKMAKFIDLMLCLFPFELPLYENAGLPAVCVGHPLLDTLADLRDPAIERDENLVALLPGSRSKEIRKIFPIMLDAATHLRMSRSKLRFEAAAASEPLAAEMRTQLAERGLDDSFCPITLGTSRSLMQRASAGIVCSGTATLEATYFGLPMAIVYRVAWLSAFIGKRLIKIPWLGLPNVLAGREIIREYIQERAVPSDIATEMVQLLDDPTTREKQLAAQREVIASLGEPGAAKRAAAAIAALLEKPAPTQ